MIKYNTRKGGGGGREDKPGTSGRTIHAGKKTSFWARKARGKLTKRRISFALFMTGRWNGTAADEWRRRAQAWTRARSRITGTVGGDGDVRRRRLTQRTEKQSKHKLLMLNECRFTRC